MNFTLEVWRQEGAEDDGRFETHEVSDIDGDASFLEMMDILNSQLIRDGKRAISFDHDCREGICGACSMTIDGIPHGERQITSCQVYMRQFDDGQKIKVEPWRASTFPVLRDLMVDRSALDRVIESGGYVTVGTGPKPEPNTTPIPPDVVAEAMDAAICIGCGACVAACPNGSAMLFTGAKASHLSRLPQGQPERYDRVQDMVARHDLEGFGGCTNHGECEAVCPQNISIKVIGDLNRDFRTAIMRHPRNRRAKMEAQ